MFGSATREPPPPLASDVSEALLNAEQLTDHDLAWLEDQLSLSAELDGRRDALTSGPRIMLFVLVFVTFQALLLLMARTLPVSRLGPLNILLYVAMLGVAIWLVHAGWRVVGQRVRTAIRYLFRYWPAALWLWASLLQLAR